MTIPPPPRPEQFTLLADFQRARAVHAAEIAHNAAVPEWHTAQKRARLLVLPADLGFADHAALIEALKKLPRR